MYPHGLHGYEDIEPPTADLDYLTTTPWTWVPYSIPVLCGYFRTLRFPYPNRRLLNCNPPSLLLCDYVLGSGHSCSTVLLRRRAIYRSFPLARTARFSHAHPSTPFPFAVTILPASVLAYHLDFVSNCGRDYAGLCVHTPVGLDIVQRTPEGLERSTGYVSIAMVDWETSCSIVTPTVPLT